jgi:hypothetical protein
MRSSKRPVIDPSQLGARIDVHSDRRRREMADIEMDAEALVSGWQEVLDRGEGRRLDHIDHDRSGQHRHLPAADTGRGVLDADQDACAPYQSRRHLGEIGHRPCLGLRKRRGQDRAGSGPTDLPGGVAGCNRSRIGTLRNIGRDRAGLLRATRHNAVHFGQPDGRPARHISFA